MSPARKYMYCFQVSSSLCNDGRHRKLSFVLAYLTHYGRDKMDVILQIKFRIERALYTPGQKFIEFFSTSCYIKMAGEIHNLSIQEWKHIVFLQICEMS